MKKFFCLALAAMISASMMPGRVTGAPVLTLIVGMVATAQGTPVTGVRIAARDASGKIVSETASDARGRYAIQNLEPGRYQLSLDTLNSSFKGQTVASAVGTEGLTVNWIVSSGAQALATATPGTGGAGLFGLSPQTTGALLFLGGVSAMTGIAAGVGAFGDNSRSRSNLTSASQ